jgi:hypothetical protein
MGFIGAILTRSDKLTCMFCGQQFRSGVSRFEGGRRVGYLCYACRAKDLCSDVSPRQAEAPAPTSHRVNAWPVNAWPAFVILFDCDHYDHCRHDAVWIRSTDNPSVFNPHVVQPHRDQRARQEQRAVGEIVAVHSVPILEMTDDGLDGGTSWHLSFDFRCL